MGGQYEGRRAGLDSSDSKQGVLVNMGMNLEVK